MINPTTGKEFRNEEEKWAALSPAQQQEILGREWNPHVDKFAERFLATKRKK
jgi:hypothetical protein